MRGDIDNSSFIELSDNPSVRSRVVYSVERVPERRMQVGIIQVSYGYVAVWRAFDPDDDRWDAPWQSNAWSNVYETVVPLDRDASTRRGKPYKTYSLAAVEREGVMGRVPRAELRMTRRLVEHLAKLSDTP